MEVEAEGEGDAEAVTSQVRQSLRIQPGFIFNIGNDYLWLANCFYAVPGFDELPGGTVKNVLSDILNTYNNAHRAAHGGQFIIRKRDGALFEWNPSDGAPSGMDDGYHAADMVLGWFIQEGGYLYVRENGFRLEHGWNSNPGGRLIRITDGGASLSYMEIIPAGEKIARILPAGGGNVGIVKWNDQRYPIPYMLLAGSDSPVEVSTPIGEEGQTCWTLISISGTLYAASSYHRGDAMEGGNKVAFYRINVSGSSASVGEKIAEINNCSVAFDDDKWFGPGAATNQSTFTFLAQDSTDDWKWHSHTLDPASGTVKSRRLPEHYNENMNMYVDGVACEGATDKGFWLCDLSKDAAEWIELDWSNASSWQAKVSSMSVVHYEMANMSLKYECNSTGGGSFAAWVPIAGKDKGKVAVYTDESGDAGFDVSVVVDM